MTPAVHAHIGNSRRAMAAACCFSVMALALKVYGATPRAPSPPRKLAALTNHAVEAFAAFAEDERPEAFFTMSGLRRADRASKVSSSTRSDNVDFHRSFRQRDGPVDRERRRGSCRCYRSGVAPKRTLFATERKHCRGVTRYLPAIVSSPVPSVVVTWLPTRKDCYPRRGMRPHLPVHTTVNVFCASIAGDRQPVFTRLALLP